MEEVWKCKAASNQIPPTTYQTSTSPEKQCRATECKVVFVGIVGLRHPDYGATNGAEQLAEQQMQVGQQMHVKNICVPWWEELPPVRPDLLRHHLPHLRKFRSILFKALLELDAHVLVSLECCRPTHSG
jgi:hypothetical protein